MDGKGIDSYLLWRWKRENFSGDRIGSAGSREWNEGPVYAIFKDGRFGRIENSRSDQRLK